MPVGDLSALNISRHGWFTVYVYFKSKTKEGKSVERQGRKATEPEAQ